SRGPGPLASPVLESWCFQIALALRLQSPHLSFSHLRIVPRRSRLLHQRWSPRRLLAAFRSRAVPRGLDGGASAPLPGAPKLPCTPGAAFPDQRGVSAGARGFELAARAFRSTL